MAELPKTRVKLAKHRLQRCSSSDARLPITVMNCRRFHSITSIATFSRHSRYF
jgi:hypothetical protein